MPEKEPLVDRVRAEYERRRRLAATADDREAAAEMAADAQHRAHLDEGGDPPLVARPGPAGLPHEVVDLDELADKLGAQLGPFQRAPAMFIPYHVKRELLQRLFAGIELGQWDASVLGWLANADGDTVVALAGMVYRAIADAVERA